jgi:hypothetical protein
MSFFFLSSSLVALNRTAGHRFDPETPIEETVRTIYPLELATR